MLLRTLSLLLIVGCSLPGWSAEPEDKFERWQKEIAAIEQRDAEQKIPLGTTVFVGSSSIRLWNLKQSFPDHTLANHGFGGSTIADSVHFIEPLVLKLQPKTVVFYAGDNDIQNGLSPQQVHADFEAFVKAVEAKLPQTKIIFIPIKPSPARWKLYDKQREANRLIRETMTKDAKRLVYLDIVTPMLGDDGQPRPELLQKDMLHLNETGYALWAKLLLPELK
jgi:lysophospholipase L1-like esterase